MMKRVAVVGTGTSPFSTTSPQVSYREMIFQAASRCYTEAGIHPQDIDAFVASAEDFMEGISISDEYVPDQLGAVLKPVETIAGDGLQGLAAACMQIQTGALDLVAVSAFSKASNIQQHSGIISYACDPFLIRSLNENPYFLAGLEMQRYLTVSGNTQSECALVAAENRVMALNNPQAAYGAPITGEDVLYSNPTFLPLKELDMASSIDGAIVLLLAREELAENFKKPIWIRGIGWATDSPHFDSRLVGLGEALYAQLAAERAYQQAHIRRPQEEISFGEIDDTFSYKELQHLEALGLCQKGTAGREFAAGTFSSGGKIPINVSGGNLGVGYLHEANGLHKVLEVVLQLQEEAGKRQLQDIHTGLAFAWRGIPTATGSACVLSLEKS